MSAICPLSGPLEDCAGDAGVAGLQKCLPDVIGLDDRLRQQCNRTCFCRQLDFLQFSHRAFIVRVEYNTKLEIDGRTSLISSTRLPSRSALMQVTPVTFSPGRRRFVTSPAGSSSQVSATI